MSEEHDDFLDIDTLLGGVFVIDAAKREFAYDLAVSIQRKGIKNVRAAVHKICKRKWGNEGLKKHSVDHALDDYCVMFPGCCFLLSFFRRNTRFHLFEKEN